MQAAPTAEAASVAEEAPAGSSPPERALSSIASQLQGAGSSKQQNQLLLQFARRLDPLSEQERTYGNRVMGCTSQVRTGRCFMLVLCASDDAVCCGA